MRHWIAMPGRVLAETARGHQLVQRRSLRVWVAFCYCDLFLNLGTALALKCDAGCPRRDTSRREAPAGPHSFLRLGCLPHLEFCGTSRCFYQGFFSSSCALLYKLLVRIFTDRDLTPERGSDPAATRFYGHPICHSLSTHSCSATQIRAANSS
jgi:hypothetical protein